MTLNQYEWMLLNVDELVSLIIEEGSLHGPKTDAKLREVQRLESTARIKEKARLLLQSRLVPHNLGHLV